MEPKKVLAINGSPRGRKSNTDRLLQPFLQGAAEGGAVCETVYAVDLNIKECIGCYTCWKKTPGVCVFEDDMPQLLEKMQQADILVWATPVYHFGMNVRLRRIVERTLPTRLPYMVKKGERYSHPPRYKGGPATTVLIANCGFPDRSNFDQLVGAFQKIAGNGGLNATILCGGGEILAIPELQSNFEWYIKAVRQAGREIAQLGTLARETAQTLEKPLISVDLFVQLANASWHVAGETPPSLEESLGVKEAHLRLNEDLPIFDPVIAKEIQNQPGSGPIAEVIKGMAARYNPKHAPDLAAVLQFKITDGPHPAFYHLQIAAGKCEFHDGPAAAPNLTIITPGAVWLAVVRGELDGTKALMEGKYSFEGDLDLLMRMSSLFGSADEAPSAQEASKIAPGPVKIPGMQWLTVAFLPWIYFWIFSGSHRLSAFVIPWVLSAGILLYRAKYIELTLMDIGSPIFFGCGILGYFFFPQAFFRYGPVLGTLAQGFVWALTLITDKPLTAAYSKYNYPAGFDENPLFITINAKITAFWVAVYMIQAAIAIAAPNSSAYRSLWLTGSYILLIPAFIFTARFPKWYINRCGKRGSGTAALNQ